MKIRRGLVLLMIALGMAACAEAPAPPPPDEPAEPKSSPTKPPKPITAGAAPTKEQQTTTAQDTLGGTSASNGQTGVFDYRVEKPSSPTYESYYLSVAFSAPVIRGLELFNATLSFPTDLPVYVKECEMTNAFYYPSEHMIVICYEMIHAFHTSYSALGSTLTEAEKLDVTSKATAFIALHEAGHAFIGENHLAVLGKEEDAVDDISAVMFIVNKDFDVPWHGTRALINVAPGASAFADEHSFSAQRYFSALCLIYGSDPVGFAPYVGSQDDWLLPPERAQRCPSEWQTKQAALKQLTAPFVRKTPAPMKGVAFGG